MRFLCGVTEVIRADRWTVHATGGQILSRKQLPLQLAWALSIHKSQVNTSAAGRTGPAAGGQGGRDTSEGEGAGEMLRLWEAKLLQSRNQFNLPLVSGRGRICTCLTTPSLNWDPSLSSAALLAHSLCFKAVWA